MKVCTKCHEEKPLSEFSKRSRSKDGLAYYCKACFRKYQSAYRSKNGNRLRTAADDYNSRNPDRRSALNKVRYAVRTGKLAPVSECKCQHCGRQAEEYHHPDYSNPLGVVALCISCHRRAHA